MPGQPNIETRGFLWVEEGEGKLCEVAEVAPVLPISKTYTYAVPEDLSNSIQVGQRVTVPMGRKGTSRVGFVVGRDRIPWNNALRPIESVVDERSFLSEHLVALARRIADHYAAPLGATLKALTPEDVRKGAGLTTVRLVSLIRDEHRNEPAENDKSTIRITPRRRAVLDELEKHPRPTPIDELRQRAGASDAVLRAMRDAGLIKIEKVKRLPEEAETPRQPTDPDFALNDHQAAALSAMCNEIDNAEFSVSLLYGVAGSGKTEVYIRAMRHALAAGKQAILLVPEIVLTTQLVDRLAARFERVSVLHSGMTPAQRSRAWHAIERGLTPVVIGTRSAVFAPCPNLGLVCVDEEQEPSFKNLQSPRFHVRDVAIMRAQLLGASVLLGSATPAVESWHLSGSHESWRRLSLPQRVRELPMPKITIVDMQDEWAERQSRVVLSRSMRSGLEACLSRGEQAILLMNRRGFANRIVCPKCHARVTCPNCNVGMVVHAAKGRAQCHYCRTFIPEPITCETPGCGTKLISAGLGTQRVEESLSQFAPGARIARADSDTMTRREHYERLVRDFTDRKIDVLVGTQMIAKGLDFPGVSFVGVVDADVGLLESDFRGHERLFQLITQVAGRAGRAAAAGHVVVQTASPDLPALKHALRGDYAAFAEEELHTRAKIAMPPYRRIARAVLAHPRESDAKRECATIAELIRTRIDSMNLPRADVLGPAPCALTRVRNRYRYDLLIRTATAADLHALLSDLDETGTWRKRKSTITLDVDPVSMT